MYSSPFHLRLCTAKAKESLSRSLATLDQYLLDKTYLVGEKITLADITVASALVYPLKFVMAPHYRAPFVNVLRWFETCVNQPQFQRVIGTVVLCAEELTADGSVPVPAPAPVPSATDAAPAQGEIMSASAFMI
jgi:elongation factor 1-gamma